MDNAGATGAVQTWPLQATATVAVAPLPQDVAANAPDAAAIATSDAPREFAVPAVESAVAATPPSLDTAAIATVPPTTAITSQTAAPASFGEPTGAAGAVGGTVLALLLVVGVILALAWLAKRMPGLGAVGGGNPALKIVGSLALGPRERVVVVDVGGTQLLLSTGPHGTRALHTLEQPLPVPANAPSPFAQVLARQFGKKPS